MSSIPLLPFLLCAVIAAAAATTLLRVSQGSRRRRSAAAPDTRDSRSVALHAGAAASRATASARPQAAHRLSCPERWSPRAASSASAAPTLATSGGDSAEAA